MGRYATFLRGINLGNRRPKKEQLRGCFEQLGFSEVATFRASGNVVFTAAKREAEAKLTARIEAALEEALGYEVAAFLRTEAEVREIAGREPFAARALAASKGKLQVALLPKKRRAAAANEVLAMAGDDDGLAIEGRELFWLPSGGTLESGLDLRAIEALIGPWTMRTMGTIEQIAGKYFAD